MIGLKLVYEYTPKSNFDHFFYLSQSNFLSAWVVVNLGDSFDWEAWVYRVERVSKYSKMSATMAFVWRNG